MAKSFFEKLKKGMGIELPIEEELEMEVREIEIENQDEEERIIKKTRKKAIKKKPKKKMVVQKSQVKTKKLDIKAKLVKPRISKKEILKTKQIKPDTLEQKEDWLVPEGQLLIDVYQTKNELVIQSAIAGIKPEELNIVLESDIITIRGNRKKPIEEQGDYFTKECYWGRFSRKVILPVEVNPNRAKISMKGGILIIRIPKILREKKRKISVKNIGE